jgi:hypothetical protein
MAHNSMFEQDAPEFVKERNKKLLDAYFSLITTIEKIQGFLEDEYLRSRIQSKMMLCNDTKSTMYQCTTLWCILSIGCDEMGRYNIVYSLDHRIQKMIGEVFTSTFIRRICEFTPGAMVPFVKIGSLYEDCVLIYDSLLVEAETTTFHEVIIASKHS